MRQSTLVCAFGVKREQEGQEGASVPARKPDVYELFCGAGGFAAGAKAAGCRVVFACDKDANALQTHERNHPSTIRLQCELPCATLPLPTASEPPWHLHASPPCQKFSKVNKNGREDGDQAHALDLVTWCIDLALRSAATTWSMEQVASREVVGIVARKRLESGCAFEYAVFDFEELGVPQTRRRLMAGSPELIARLLRSRNCGPKRSVAETISWPRGTHVRGGSTGVHQRRKIASKPGEPKYSYEKASWTDLCRSISKPSYTVLGKHALVWVTKHKTGCSHSVMSAQELASLQTFPASYVWPENKAEACLQIGNAIPPLVVTRMLA